jgi:peroxiredoxin
MLEEGDAAPKFVNPDRKTKYVFSRNEIGKGWVILDFFATDCEGCKKELPELEELNKEFKDYGVVIIVFAVDEEGHDIVNPYFEKHTTELTILIDRYKKTAITYGVDEIPAVFLINPEGMIVLKRVKYAEEHVKEIKAILAESLFPSEALSSTEKIPPEQETDNDTDTGID